MTIPRPSLDRAAELRDEPDVIGRLRDDPATRVIVVREGRVRVVDSTLLRVPAETVVEATWALLGRDADGTVLLLAAAPPETDALDTAPDEVWLGLRDLGGRIDGQRRSYSPVPSRSPGGSATHRSAPPAVVAPSCATADGRDAASCAGGSTSRARIRP